MEGNKLMAIVFGVLLACSLVATGYLANTEATVEIKEVAVENTYNDSVVLSELSAIKADLLEDDDWEIRAQAIAEAEWNDEDEIFDFLFANAVDIVDEDDIDRVVIIDCDVSNADSDDEDADVTCEVKVYYEDSDGDDKKVYLDIDTEILDGEAEDVVYALA